MLISSAGLIGIDTWNLGLNCLFGYGCKLSVQQPLNLSRRDSPARDPRHSPGKLKTVLITLAAQTLSSVDKREYLQVKTLQNPNLPHSPRSM